MGRGNGTFRPFTFKDAYFSFPSGHTVVAFSLSTVLAERIGNPWATAGLYGAATACAVSRVYRQEHWLSDIVLGAALSTAVSHSLVQWYEGGREPSLTSRLHILPGIQGVALVWAL